MKFLALLSFLFISNSHALSLAPLVITGPAAEELYQKGFTANKSRTIYCVKNSKGASECSLKAFVKMPEDRRMCTQQVQVMFNPTTGECRTATNGCMINDLMSIGFRAAENNGFNECGF